MREDTIAAISTGMTPSGIGIVRMSGEKSIEIADDIFVGKKGRKLAEASSHTLHYGHIFQGEQLLDEVLVSVMKAPDTYTGEDIIEINCHGSVLLLQNVLELLISKGCRLSEPGEFTKRAFLNGKIDLSKAEAVMDLIDAQNNMALHSSIHQLSGSVSNKIGDLRKIILEEVSYIEAVLDDPEHMDFEKNKEIFEERIHFLEKELKMLIGTFSSGTYMKEGIKTVIIGKPNAGKSSLLNALSGLDKAIVTDIAGTTRDILEQSIHLEGITIQLIDTAGIRETDNLVEEIGVNKAKEYIEEGDLILYIVDASSQLDEEDEKIIQSLKDKKVIILMNKMDLKSSSVKTEVLEKLNAPMIQISALYQQGIQELRDEIKSMFLMGEVDFNHQVIISSLRQKQELELSLESIQKVKNSYEMGMPEDFLTIDLMDVYAHLGNIIGESVDEDLINHIFSSFCVGK